MEKLWSLHQIRQYSAKSIGCWLWTRKVMNNKLVIKA